MTKRRALFSSHLRFLLSFFLGLALVGSMVVFQEQVGSTSSEPPQVEQQAQALIDKGQQQLSQGHASSAVETWKQAEQLFRQMTDAEGVTGSLVNQSVALQALGEYPRACTSLAEALALDSSVCPGPFQAEESPAKVKTVLAQALSKQAVSPVQALALHNLGDVHRQLGNLETSETVLRQGLEKAQQRSPESDASGLLLSLANTKRAFYSRSRSLYQRQAMEADQDQPTLQTALAQARQALKLYQTATQKQSSPATTLAAKLNQLALLLDLEEWATSEARFGVASLKAFHLEAQPRIIPLAQQLITTDFSQLPALEAINTRTNLANSLLKIEQSSELAPLLEKAGQNPGQLALEYARTAMQAAEQVGNLRLQSAAAGLMGRLHRQQSQPQLARREFTAAMQAAQADEAWDLAYQSQKELGDIYEQQGNLNQATASYGAAVSSLEQVRGTLLASDPEFQFSFREKVEPVYQRYMRLLLAESNPNLKEVIQINEQLQQAELENYLKCEKLDLVSPNQIEEYKSHPTFLYVLNLGDRFEEIILTPDGKLHRHRPDTAIVADNANRLLTYLTDKSLAFTPETAYLPYAQALYDQLIAPIKLFIPTSGTLVFSLDSTLQSIPMDMLYDGEAYLFEQYSTALTLGSRIRPPQALPPDKLKILLAGLSEASPSFQSAQVPDNLQPLPVVQNEIDKISVVASSNKELLNDTFTHQRFQELVHSFPIVHVATHGQFSSNPDQTNILAWDQPINVSEFSSLLREQGNQVTLELLTLSACETAKGDKRSALGMAGVAVRAGARSTLASLWLVDEESTAELMNEFYKNLQAGVPKAEAKRQAQLTLRRNPQTANPYLWGPFVLVGSWL